MYFTFLVITYNHEEFIIQHLESIKFQIANYGEGYTFQLVISDDFSKDGTINLIKQWLKFNKSLFKSIKVLESDVNVGTCKNYVRGIKSVDGQYFKSLAGDDLYAKDNIFKAVELLKKYDIVVTPTAPFTDNELFNDLKIYSRIYQMYKFINTPYEKIKKNLISIPMTPGVFIKKDLLIDDVLNFISEFKLIEDRSKNIKLYEINNNLKFGLYEKILLMYRYHTNAITKTTNTKIRNAFHDDSKALYKYVNKSSSNVVLRFKNSYYSLLTNIRNKKIRQLLNIGMWVYRLSFLINYNKYKDSIRDIINNSYMPNKGYLEYIQTEAGKYDKQ